MYNSLHHQGTLQNSKMAELNQTRRLAKEINDSPWVSYPYGFLDALIISYSSFKAIFDLSCSSSSKAADEMHDWMVAPHGMALEISLTGLLIFLSMANNRPPVKDSSKESDYVKKAAKSWQYFRDVFKGFKFSYKGIRSTLQLFALLDFDVQKISFVPIGLTFGTLAATNRFIYRLYIMDPRKAFKDRCSVLLEEAKALGNDYEFCEMPEDIPDEEYKENVIYLEIDERDGERKLKYKVRSSVEPKGLLTGEIAFAELADAFVEEKETADGQKEKVKVELSVDYFKKHYFQQIRARICNNHNTSDVQRIAYSNTEKRRSEILAEIDKQKLKAPWAAWVYAVYSGCLDGLYSYIGILTITTVSTPMLTMLAAVTAFFWVCFIINRCYEEYEYNLELKKSQESVRLVLLSKRVEEFFWTLHNQQERSLQGSESVMDDRDKYIDVYKQFGTHLDTFASKREELQKLTNLSHFQAALKGVQSGMYLYGAFCAFLSVLNIASILFSFAFPMWVLIAGIPLVCALLLVNIALSVYLNYNHLKIVNAKEDERVKWSGELSRIIAAKTAGKDIDIDSSNERDVIDSGLVIIPCPEYLLRCVGEVFRSMLAALGKGQRSINFILNPLLQLKNGHYQETSPLTVMGVLLSLVYGVSYGLKSFGKQLKTGNELPGPSNWAGKSAPGDRFFSERRKKDQAERNLGGSPNAIHQSISGILEAERDSSPLAARSLSSPCSP